MLKVLEVWSVISLVSLVGVAVAECPKGDLSGDCRVDFKDVEALAGQWLNPSDFPGDLDGLNGVEWRDFALIAHTWRQKGIPLVINEFMASNSGGDLDPQGQDDDWIEIYNAGNEAIDMNGMYLTNNLDNAEKWRIPNGTPALTTIQPGGYLIIWADIDEEDYPAGLHANFRIDAGGGELGLFDSNSAVRIDKVDFPDQTPNISYGRFPDGNDLWQFFAFPTNEATNVGAYFGAVADTKFSRNRGFYDTPFSVSIATETEDAVIYYTLDGTEPGKVNRSFYTGTPYSGAIPINKTSCLRARAVKTGWKPSNADAQTYIFLDDVIAQPPNPDGFPSYWSGTAADYEMDPTILNDPRYRDRIKSSLLSLPVMSIATDVDNLFDSATGIYANPSNRGIAWEKPTSVEYFDSAGVEEFHINCGLRIQGGWFRPLGNCRKKSFRLLFKGMYGSTKLNFPLFGANGVDSFDTITLRAGANDGYSWRDAKYTEQYTRDQFGRSLQAATGHAASRGSFVHLYVNGLYWGLYNPSERPDNSFAASHYGGEKDNWDWPWKNYYTARQQGPQSTGFKFFCWDCENTLGNNLGRSNLDKNALNNNFSHMGEPHTYLRQNAEYKMQFADRIHGFFFNGGILTPASLISRYSEMANEVELSIISESARWGDQHHNPPLTLEDWYDSDGDYGDGRAGRGWIMDYYLPQRTDVVLQQFRNAGLYPNVDAPVFYINGSYRHGGYISPTDSFSISAASGTIYYTLDGNDPRLPGGALNTAHAIAYSGAVSLTASTHVKARAKSGSVWSALNEAIFAVGPVAESLRISELMYHPLEWGDPEDPNREFIELTNIGSESINLNMVRFTNGIDFTFPDTELAPGDYVLVVRNTLAFLEHYQGVSGTILGEYTGRLSNGGERIELEDAVGQTILNFKYKDSWYNLTDGDGFTLTIRNPSDSTAYDWDNRLTTHWKLDDGAGATAIDSVGGNDGTLHGDTAWTFGLVNEALSFDGDADYVSFPSVDTLTGTSVTVQAWVRMNDSAGLFLIPIVMQHTSGGEGYRLYLFEDKPSFAILAKPRGVTVGANSPDPITRNQWHHIAGTNDGSELKIYVDGQLMASTPSAGYTGFAHEGYIGYLHTGTACWDGLIDDVRIYDRALTDDELLVTSDSTQRWNQKSSWRASAFMLGSPGWDDSGIVPNPGAVVINEIMAHSHGDAPDWIELYNTTDVEIDIGRWYLSDSKALLKKYQFAAGTKIGAHDYLVLDEDLNFGSGSSDPGRIRGFAFSENGDEVYLSSGESGTLTGYREVESFGASYTGISFGRYFKRSTGNYNFVPMDSNTPSDRNAYPAVGPIVINEIMYNPDWPNGGSYGNDRYEYIELKNITDEPVRLWREDKALPWKFKDGVDYTFPDAPSDVTIAAGDYIVVVRDIAAFMWRYPSVPAAKIFGPYEGQLDDGGEELELEMPGDTDKFGRQHYIRVDRVTYSDGSHHDDAPGGVDLWPVEADGEGKSLSRVVASLYGNDPNNWTAEDPSPGE